MQGLEGVEVKGVGEEEIKVEEEVKIEENK